MTTPQHKTKRDQREATAAEPPPSHVAVVGQARGWTEAARTAVTRANDLRTYMAAMVAY